jgi:hypothetical protein
MRVLLTSRLEVSNPDSICSLWLLIVSLVAQAQERELVERDDVADALEVVENHGRLPDTLAGLDRARAAMSWRLEANAHELNAVLSEYRTNYALSDEIDRRIAALEGSEVGDGGEGTEEDEVVGNLFDT